MSLKYGIEPVVTLSHFEMPYRLVKNYGDVYKRQHQYSAANAAELLPLVVKQRR